MMADRWETSKEPQPDNLSAYADAWDKLEGDFLPSGLLDRSTFIFGDRGDADPLSGKKVAGDFYFGGDAVPMPKGCNNSTSVTESNQDNTAKELPKDIADDTVIVGIVDTGIALGHRRFRGQNGKTRFLASWQQSAQHRGQKDLPSGHEVYADEINAYLEKHSSGDMIGYLDEDAFNRDLQLVDVERPLGNRDLELSAAHGTHVLDLATGMDPENASPEEMLRQRIVAVNLPAQYSHGSAGNFLAYFAVHAVERILHIADSQWSKIHPAPGEKTIKGYPIVINFSYGMHAGPKDGNHIFERALRDIIAEREKKAKGDGWTDVSPVRIAMPAGNDNLLRGAASVLLGKGSSKTIGYKATEVLELPWRIKPADATANFLEIWTEAQNDEVFSQVLERMEVSVMPPNFSKTNLSTLEDKSVHLLGNDGFARAYITHEKIEPQETGGDERTRLGLLIAVAATQSDLPNAPNAPAGEWKITIKYDGDPVDVTLYIQSDQPAVRVSKTGLRSYFDHEKYMTHLENGAIADNYSIAAEATDSSDFENHDNWYEHGPVQRKGTHNAISSREMNENLVVIGGYNDQDGYPASYSASTDGDRQSSSGRTIITTSYPSENGGQFGLLAAGARDGSVRAYRGTSMATALATRDIAATFMRNGPDPKIGTERWLRSETDKFEDYIETRTMKDQWGKLQKWPLLPKVEGKLKMGVGRMPSPYLFRLRRS